MHRRSNSAGLRIPCRAGDELRSNQRGSRHRELQGQREVDPVQLNHAPQPSYLQLSTKIRVLGQLRLERPCKSHQPPAEEPMFAASEPAATGLHK